MENGWPQPEQFLQSKRQGTRSGETWHRVTKTGKGAKYGIPDSSCRRINDGALRADHGGLPGTTRMVTYSLADQPTSVTGRTTSTDSGHDRGRTHRIARQSARVLRALERRRVRAGFLADNAFDLLDRFVLVFFHPFAHFEFENANVIDPTAQ